MTDELFQALSAEGRRQGIIDPDIVRCYPALTNDVSASDEKAIHEAVHAMKKRSPKLFRETDWAKMDTARFSAQEEEFRSDLRTHYTVPENKFKSLDAALISDEEASALRRYLSGGAGSSDKSILRAALKRQMREGLVPSDAA